MNQNKEQPPMTPMLAWWIIKNAPPTATHYDRQRFVFLRPAKCGWEAMDDAGKPNGLTVARKDAQPIPITRLIETYEFYDDAIWLPECRPFGHMNFEPLPVLDDPAKPPVITTRTLFLFCVFAFVVVLVQWGASCAM